MIDRPGRWVSIDPGDIHVGFATWCDDECLAAVEMTPRECKDTLYGMVERGVLETIVCEKFALYAWNEKSMAGNEFLTVKLIGVIEEIAERNGIDFVGQFASVGKRIYKMGWYLELTAKEKRQLPWGGHGGHAKDAWAHGEWFKRQRAKG